MKFVTANEIIAIVLAAITLCTGHYIMFVISLINLAFWGLFVIAESPTKESHSRYNENSFDVKPNAWDNYLDKHLPKSPLESIFKRKE